VCVCVCKHAVLPYQGKDKAAFETIRLYGGMGYGLHNS
jgi:hypothetical protein